MYKYPLQFCLLLSLSFVSALFAQEHDTHAEQHIEKSPAHESHTRHLISASINHTIIFSAIKNNESKSAQHVPSLGLNYTYEINPKWGIGLHSDIILEEFVIENTGAEGGLPENENEGIEFIERETPVAVAVVGIFKPFPFLGLLAGAGREFSPKEDFNLIRFGAEAPIHLPNHWEVFGVITYDINIDAYNSLNYGIGFGKMF